MSPVVPVVSPPSSWASHLVDVKDFGAVGDGIADDTPKIQAAINSTAWNAVNGGKLVLLSGGKYKTTAPLNMVEGGCITQVSPLRGLPSPYLASIEFYGGPSDNCIQAIGSAAHRLSRCIVERFRINDRRVSPTGGNGVYYENVDNQTWVRNMDIVGFPTGASVRITGVSNTSDCIVVDDIWGIGSKYAVNADNMDNDIFIRDIKCDSFSTDPLIAAIRVSRINGACIISGIKHENRKASAVTIQLDTVFNNTLIEGVISRVGAGGAAVSMVAPAGSGSSVAIIGVQREFSGTLLDIPGRPALTGTRLPIWVGGSDGYQVNGARVVGQYDAWTRLRLEGDVMVAPIAGNKLGFYGTSPVVKPALTYSRATETAASTQLRTTLVNLGLVTDSTVP